MLIRQFNTKGEAAIVDKFKNPKFFIDITEYVCPLTFVKTKLLLETMAAGEVAEVRLKGAEAVENVPRSIREHGHTILSLELEYSKNSVDKVYRLIIQKY
tara:strand:+ start:226 stop:525 length:300 start_codon:yes stop_codon:yes gene_type:complete